MSDRILPTDEDRQIIKRNWWRMLKWTHGLPADKAMGCLNRFVSDFQHNKPTTK